MGCHLYERDRSAEHRDILRQIADICVDRKPDALIVAGDLYDNDHPTASDQRLVAEAFARLHKLLPEMKVVVTAGNHDSPSRLESHAAVYAMAGVAMIGRLNDRDSDWPDKYLVDTGTGVIAAIPYYISRGTSTAELLEAADRLADGRPVVAMAHTAMTGSDITGHDGRIIGMLEAVDPDSYLPEGSYDYLALGHIHRPQWVGRSGRVRYSGSPLQVSFDEFYSHTLSVVEIGARGDMPVIEEIEIEQSRPAVTLPSIKRWDEWDKALEALRQFPDNIPAYIRLNVLTDGPLPSSAEDDARRAVKGKECEFCHINVRRKASEATDGMAGGMTVAELRMVSPADVARRYAASVGAELDMELFDEVVRSLTNKNPDDETA